MWVYICRPIGDVAQLVEQRIENPCVGGSIPPRSTSFFLLLLLTLSQVYTTSLTYRCSLFTFN